VPWKFQWEDTPIKGQITTEIVSSHPVSAETKIKSLASPVVVCGGQRGNGAGLSQVLCHIQ
jgi:hypothetical protein